MKQNLDTLRNDIASHLKNNGFVTFHGFSRGFEEIPEVEWDTVHYPDYKLFLEVAQQLGIKLVVMHHREFSSAIIDRAVDELNSSGYEYEDQRGLEQRLRELAMYDGFTCTIELSFDYSGTLYIFEVRTEWYNEVNAILDELDLMSEDQEEEDEDDSRFGGYYSKN
jgi:hypothetical protein